MILSSTVEKVLAGAGSISSEIEKKDKKRWYGKYTKITISKINNMYKKL